MTTLVLDIFNNNLDTLISKEYIAEKLFNEINDTIVKSDVNDNKTEESDGSKLYIVHYLVDYFLPYLKHENEIYSEIIDGKTYYCMPNKFTDSEDSEDEEQENTENDQEVECKKEYSSDTNDDCNSDELNSSEAEEEDKEDKEGKEDFEKSYYESVTSYLWGGETENKENKTEENTENKEEKQKLDSDFKLDSVTDNEYFNKIVEQMYVDNDYLKYYDSYKWIFNFHSFFMGMNEDQFTQKLYENFNIGYLIYFYNMLKYEIEDVKYFADKKAYEWIGVFYTKNYDKIIHEMRQENVLLKTRVNILTNSIKQNQIDDMFIVYLMFLLNLQMLWLGNTSHCSTQSFHLLVSNGLVAAMLFDKSKMKKAGTVISFCTMNFLTYMMSKMAQLQYVIPSIQRRFM